MTQVLNSTMNKSSEETQGFRAKLNDQTESAELKLIRSNCIKDASPMPEGLKKEANESAPSMTKLFEEIIRQKGEISNLEKVDDHTYRIDDISGLALHSFALKAQEFGKDVTYTKETIITIS